jgi:hypothetical protein
MIRLFRFAAGLFILSLACTLPVQVAREAVQINPSVREDDVEMNTLIENELTRVRTLLDNARVATTLEEIQPIQPPENIGALAGLGFKAYDPDVTTSVYVFETMNQHAAAVEKLREGIPTEDTRILHATNGRLLFFGYTDTSGENGRAASYRLAGIVSAFAGNE